VIKTKAAGKIGQTVQQNAVVSDQKERRSFLKQAGGGEAWLVPEGREKNRHHQKRAGGGEEQLLGNADSCLPKFLALEHASERVNSVVPGIQRWFRGT